MRTKKFTKQAKSGIKGEAFFESIISDYAIPHHVTGPKDLGIDYFCEWVYGDNPTGLLFGVQIKTVARNNVKNIELTDKKCKYNLLEEYRIRYNHLKITAPTLEYLKKLNIPIYLFLLIVDGESIDYYYKRYTTALTKNKKIDIEFSFSGFYKANNHNKLIAFADSTKHTHGFARDLLIDHVRINYSHGYFINFDEIDIGLKQYPYGNRTIFSDLIDEYKDTILPAFTLTQIYLEERGYIKPEN